MITCRSGNIYRPNLFDLFKFAINNSELIDENNSPLGRIFYN